MGGPARVLGNSSGVLGVAWGVLGGAWCVLGGAWRVLGAPWEVPGRPSVCLWGSLGVLGGLPLIVSGGSLGLTRGTRRMSRTLPGSPGASRGVPRCLIERYDKFTCSPGGPEDDPRSAQGRHKMTLESPKASQVSPRVPKIWSRVRPFMEIHEKPMVFQ